MAPTGSDSLHIVAEARTEFGKGAARRVRRADKVPAVMYGHGGAPVHLTLPGHDTMMALKHTNALLTIEFGGKQQLALVRDVQRDVIKGFIEHVDLVLVRKGEKVHVEVAVHVRGDAAPETFVTVDMQTLELAVDATHIPENVVVDVEGARAGTRVLAGDVTLPAGAELLTDPDYLVVNVTQAMSEEALEAELAEAEEGAGIEHEEHEGAAAEAPAVAGEEKPAGGSSEEG